MVRRPPSIGHIASYEIDFDELKITACVSDRLERSSDKKLGPFMAHKTSRGRAWRKHDVHDENGLPGGVDVEDGACHWILCMCQLCKINQFLCKQREVL